MIPLLVTLAAGVGITLVVLQEMWWRQRWKQIAADHAIRCTDPGMQRYPRLDGELGSTRVSVRIEGKRRWRATRIEAWLRMPPGVTLKHGDESAAQALLSDTDLAHDLADLLSQHGDRIVAGHLVMRRHGVVVEALPALLQQITRIGHSLAAACRPTTIPSDPFFRAAPTRFASPLSPLDPAPQPTSLLAVSGDSVALTMRIGSVSWSAGALPDALRRGRMLLGVVDGSEQSVAVRLVPELNATPLSKGQTVSIQARSVGFDDFFECALFDGEQISVLENPAPLGDLQHSKQT